MKVNPTNTVYIDGDILPYKIGFATQRIVYQLDQRGWHSVSPILVTSSKRQVNKYLKLNPDLLVTEYFYVEEPIQVINTVKLAIQNIVKGSKCLSFKVIVSGDTNFRDNIATIQPYKGNREGSEKPVHFKLIRDWLIDKSYTILSDNEEADDVLSRVLLEGHVCATIDKDLNNTPGLHYNFNKNELYNVTEEQATINFYKQILTGDTADNIPGIKGIGPVKADNIITSCEDVEEMEYKILSIYEKVYSNPVEAMIEVGQLLWMRREINEMWYPEYIPRTA